MSRSLDTQYVTFYAILGELPMEPEDSASERAHKVHVRAYQLLQASYKNFPGRLEMGQDEVEIDVHELCEDDVGNVERDGKTAWGIGFASHRNMKLEQLLPLRDLVAKAYEDAAAEHGMPVRFAGAKRYNVLRVTETSEVDFESESPAIGDAV